MSATRGGTVTEETFDWSTYPIHPKDLPGAAPGEDSRSFYRSCPSHCCFEHGCKYQHPGCPVETGAVAQDHPCEQCTDDLDDAAAYGHGYSNPGEVGFTVLFAAKRTDGNTPMGSLPSRAHVAGVVSQALAGLDLGDGWTIARIPRNSQEEAGRG